MFIISLSEFLSTLTLQGNTNRSQSMPSHVKEKLGKVKIQESSENNCVLPVSQNSEHDMCLHVYDAHTSQCFLLCKYVSYKTTQMALFVSSYLASPEQLCASSSDPTLLNHVSHWFLIICGHIIQSLRKETTYFFHIPTPCTWYRQVLLSIGLKNIYMLRCLSTIWHTHSKCSINFI